MLMWVKEEIVLEQVQHDFIFTFPQPNKITAKQWQWTKMFRFLACKTQFPATLLKKKKKSLHSLEFQDNCNFLPHKLAIRWQVPSQVETKWYLPQFQKQIFQDISTNRSLTFCFKSLFKNENVLVWMKPKFISVW